MTELTEAHVHGGQNSYWPRRKGNWWAYDWRGAGKDLRLRLLLCMGPRAGATSYLGTALYGVRTQ